MSRPEPPSLPRSRCAPSGGLFLRLAVVMVLAAAPAPAAGPYLVHDLGLGVDYPWSFVGLRAQPVEMGGALYFFHDDGVHGEELWRSDGTALGTYLVRDLCPGACGSHALGAFGALAALGSTVLFAGHDGVHGLELWATDGTAGGTRLVADLRPGLASSTPRNFLAAAGQLFFVADDGVHGQELWRSDGTAEGTYLVRDLAPGPESAGIGVLEPGAGHLFFAVSEAPEERVGLWVSDGTAAGTVRLLAVPPEGGWQVAGGTYRRFNTLPDGTLLFTVLQPNNDVELWRSDGTAAGTYFLRRVGYQALGGAIGIVGDAGYLVGWTLQGDAELVRSDGTPGGTEVVPLPPEARPYIGAWASSLGGRLFLAVYETLTGAEPWVVDGLAAAPLADLRPGPESSGEVFWASVSGVFSAVAGNEVVFLADDGSGAGPELWATDLTPAGTRRISDLTPGDEYPGLPNFASRLPPVALAGRLLLPTWDAGVGVRLWRADPAAGTTTVVRGVGSQTSSLRPPQVFDIYAMRPPTGCMEAVGGRLLFEARASLWDGTAGLVSTDGAFGGLEIVREIGWGSASCAVNGVHAVVHATAPGGSETDFTRTDGLPEGTEAPFVPGSGDDTWVLAPPVVPFASGWLLGTEEGLWESDGTPAGSLLVDPAAPGAYWGARIASSASGALYGSAGGLRFLAPGTAPLVLAEESSSRWVEWIVPASAGFGVVVTEEGFGTELWWTDGTPAGTGRVRDIAPGPASSIRIPFPIENSFEPPIAGKLAALGARVVFAADDGVHGEELWVSDGTEAGTFLLGDLMPGPAPSSPRDLTSAGDRLFFAAEHPVLGRELWVTDGTPAGTVPVVDLVPGAGSSRPGDLAWLGERLVFSAWTPAWGREAWRTDGTAAGTWRLTDIAPGPSSSSPGLFREVGGALLFAANDGARGFELWGITADGSVPLFRDTFESGGLQRWDEAEPIEEVAR